MSRRRRRAATPQLLVFSSYRTREDRNLCAPDDPVSEAQWPGYLRDQQLFIQCCREKGARVVEQIIDPKKYLAWVAGQSGAPALLRAQYAGWAYRSKCQPTPEESNANANIPRRDRRAAAAQARRATPAEPLSAINAEERALMEAGPYSICVARYHDSAGKIVRTTAAVVSLQTEAIVENMDVGFDGLDDETFCAAVDDLVDKYEIDERHTVATLATYPLERCPCGCDGYMTRTVQSCDVEAMGEDQP